MEPQSTTAAVAGGAATSMSDELSTISDLITASRSNTQGLISSLQNQIPDLVSSLNLSLHIISAFNHRPFDPISPNPSPSPNPNRRLNPDHQTLTPFLRRTRPKPSPESQSLTCQTTPDSADLTSIVRTMVAVCLLELVPFTEIDSSSLCRRLESESSSATEAEKKALIELGGDMGPVYAVEMALKKICEENGGVYLEEFTVNGRNVVMVWKIDRNKLIKELPESSQTLKERKEAWVPPATPDSRGVMGRMMGAPPTPQRTVVGNAGRSEIDDLKEIEELVNKKTFRETQKSKTGEELLDLIHRPTAKETAVAAKFKSKGGSQVKEYCKSLTIEDCQRNSGSYIPCEKVHFRRIISAHTDTNLGDCSFLDTCRHTKTCKYVHYELDQSTDIVPPPRPLKLRAEYCSEVELGQAQWINCDIRNFRMDILGQFGVIMADPPWDIHMELPYGTMADEEMRTLNVPALQTDGLIFLWVTGRAMELGRECLELWGYKRVEEIIWVKTNQLQRIIRTGRTGHWLNHSKEHCLVGIKGNPLVNRNIDTDVIVAEVRETSRKPDEMYPMLERISPRTRKLELFARMHNAHAGWLSLGNQLNGVRLVDEGLRGRFKAAYPDIEVQPLSPPRTTNATAEVDSTLAQAKGSSSATQYVEPSTTQNNAAN